jgi:hypothetical protein
MIPIALIISVGLLVLAVLVLVLARSGSQEYDATRRQLHEHPADTLAYDVPNGQDPADVIVALTHAGYTAVEDSTAHRVLVWCPHGRPVDRPRVRSVIEQVCASGPIRDDVHAAQVRFVDET